MAISYRQALIQTLLKIGEDERHTVPERLAATQQIIDVMADKSKQPAIPKRIRNSILGTK